MGFFFSMSFEYMLLGGDLIQYWVSSFSNFLHICDIFVTSKFVYIFSILFINEMFLRSCIGEGITALSFRDWNLLPRFLIIIRSVEANITLISPESSASSLIEENPCHTMLRRFSERGVPRNMKFYLNHTLGNLGAIQGRISGRVIL